MTLGFYDKPNYSLYKTYFLNDKDCNSTLTWYKTNSNNNLLKEY